MMSFDRFRGALGILAILGLAILLSENRKAISKRVVMWGLGLQWGFAFLVLYKHPKPTARGILQSGQWLLWFLSDPKEGALAITGDFVKNVLDCALSGASFVFGPAMVAPDGPVGFVFAFRVLPTVIFVAALFAVLYHLGVMQLIVRGFAIVMARLMRASGAESLNVAASLFLGQTEAPLTIRPYLPRLTRSELLTVMTSGMAHVSGGIMAAYFAVGVEPRHILTAVIMTAPGTILLSKLLIPETGTPETLGVVRPDTEKPDANILDAASRGTREGLALALNIAAMLIAFLGLIALINAGLGWIGWKLSTLISPKSVAVWIGPVRLSRETLAGLSLQSIFGAILAPVAWLLGVSWKDSPAVGSLLGTRTVLNELIAFGDLGVLIKAKALDERSIAISTFALCGFANFSSIGIQLGGIGALAPERRTDLAQLGFRALLAGTMANFLSACIAGILL